MRYASVKLKPRAALVDLRSFLARGWSATHGYTYVVSIADLAQTRLRVEHNLRRLIDRCTREGMAFTEDDDFDSFFRLHELTMQRVGFRAYLPQAAFRTFYHELNAARVIRVFQARLADGAPIAAQLVLLGHRVTHTVSAAADPAHLKSGASAFLRWRVFERLHQLGYEANDLTDASLNPVSHFKSQFGGELQSLVELKSPESFAFRIGSELSRFTQRSRATAAVAVRRVVGRRSPSPQ
jgi:CelD/BcsL family acetyltransferase involved in cellulose biosynthesis